MRRGERRLRQVLLPGAADIDQIVAVGTIAVQKHDELTCGTGARRQSRTIELSRHSFLFSLVSLLAERARLRAP
jgi:hypothetical protein